MDNDPAQQAGSVLKPVLHDLNHLLPFVPLMYWGTLKTSIFGNSISKQICEQHEIQHNLALYMISTLIVVLAISLVSFIVTAHIRSKWVGAISGVICFISLICDEEIATCLDLPKDCRWEILRWVQNSIFLATPTSISLHAFLVNYNAEPDKNPLLKADSLIALKHPKYNEHLYWIFMAIISVLVSSMVFVPPCFGDYALLYRAVVGAIVIVFGSWQGLK